MLLQPGYMPPLGASPYTWPNIFKNMKRMDYCVDKFDFLGNREVLPPLFPLLLPGCTAAIQNAGAVGSMVAWCG